MQHKPIKWQSNVPIINGSRYGEGSKRVWQRPEYRQRRLIEKGKGDWWKRVGETEKAWSQRARESVVGEWWQRVRESEQAKSEQALWDIGFEKCKEKLIFQLPSYAIINDHFLIGKVHVCYANVAKGWILLDYNIIEFFINLDFRIIELQKRGISLITLGKRAGCWFFCPKRAFANFFSNFVMLGNQFA